LKVPTPSTAERASFSTVTVWLCGYSERISLDHLRVKEYSMSRSESLRIDVMHPRGNPYDGWGSDLLARSRTRAQPYQHRTRQSGSRTRLVRPLDSSSPANGKDAPKLIQASVHFLIVSYLRATIMYSANPYRSRTRLRIIDLSDNHMEFYRGNKGDRCFTRRRHPESVDASMRSPLHIIHIASRFGLVLLHVSRSLGISSTKFMAGADCPNW